MRRALIAAASLLAACASAAPPPGGAEDKMPPLLLRVTPDTNALNVRERVASFYFDETINDRGTGAQEVDAYFLISPADGQPKVSWHRSRIDVRPRKGFRDNTAYTVTLLPGLADLRGNVSNKGTTVTFSTGPTIPTERLVGVVFDWPAERSAPLAYIEAITPDSVIYLAQSDSGGKFSVGPLPAGTYLLRATIDANRNRALDRNEAFDTLRVTVPRAGSLELLAAPRDTLPARIGGVTVTDSTTLKITFDRLLAPDQPIALLSFVLQGPDSAAVPIEWVRSPIAEAQASQAAARTRTDSMQRADTTAARARPPAPTPAPTPTPAASAAAARVAADSVASKPSRAAPFNSVTVRVARPLRPDTRYRLSVKGLRALGGREAPSERVFTTARAAPPRAAADSAAKRAPSEVPAATPPTPPTPTRPSPAAARPLR